MTTPTTENTLETRPGKPRNAGLFPRLRRPSPEPMSDEHAERLRAVVSDDPVPLDPSDLACADCGRVVVGPHDPSAVTFAEPDAVILPSGQVSTATAGLAAEPLVTCSTCADRRTRAADLSARFLSGGITVGGLSQRGDGVVSLVRSTLAALVVLGIPEPSAEHLTREALSTAVRHLAPLGSSLSWRSRFAPTRHPDARADTANPRPWAHVRVSDRTRLRTAYGAVMADRLALTAAPVDLAPPALTRDDLAGTNPALPVQGGCLFCGVGTVTVPALAVARLGGTARAARDVWTLRRLAPQYLGGLTSPVNLAGHLCPPCNAAAEHVGALGPSALERALVVHLGAGGTWRDDADTLAGLKGWGAVYSDTLRANCAPPQPNSTPWAHVPNLPGLARALGAGATA